MIKLKVGDTYQVDDGDPDSLAKITSVPSSQTVWMEFTKDCSWGKKGKRFAVHPAFVGKKIETEVGR